MCQHSDSPPNSRMRYTREQGTGHPTKCPSPSQNQGSHLQMRHNNSDRNGHVTEYLQSNIECVHQKPAYRSHPMAKGRKLSTGFVFGPTAKLPRSDFMNSSIRPGNRSTGSSPVKHFYRSTAIDHCNGMDEQNKPKAGTVTPSKSPFQKERSSPARSPVPNLAYAGAKFSDPPSPKLLPKPPTHWFVDKEQCPEPGSFMEMSNVLKVMLKVQC